MQKEWVVTPKAPDTFFNELPQLPSLVAQLLYNRQLTEHHTIERFLHPEYERDVHDPFLFRDMRTAVDRIYMAIASQELVIVHGDYDADGVCGSAVLVTTLRALGANADYFLPHRQNDGYGLNHNTIEILATRNAKIIITCDCGISNRTEIEDAHNRGIDVIITDHHQQPALLPNKAIAILHPKIEGETYPDKTLSGGGVAFKFSQALLHEHKARGAAEIEGMSHEAFEKWLLDLVAISSVADMVPLLQETRVLVRYGLLVLNKSRRLGINKLLESNGNGTAQKKASIIDTGTIGFRIAPRINAAGRMEHANEALALLLEKDHAQAATLAARIHTYNTDRQKLTEELTKAAREQILTNQNPENDPVLFACDETWSPGVIGLIASRLKDEFFRPVIVLGGGHGTYVGSGRSIPQFHITQALAEIPHFFLKFGGHPQACGFSLAQKEIYDDFTKAMSAIASRELENKSLTPLLEIEHEVDLDTLDIAVWQLLERFAPFGVGNPEPLFAARNVSVVDVQPLGSDGKHMKLLGRHLTGRQVHKFVAFYCKEWLAALQPGDLIDIVFEIGLNEWNGRRELQLLIKDFKKLNV